VHSPTWLRSDPRTSLPTDPRPPIMGSAGRGSSHPRTRGGRWWLTAAGGNAGERYGRTGAEWEALEAAGWEFLLSQARLGRTTSYTEMNTVLARRPGIGESGFDLDGERHAMGELLGQLSERSFSQARLLISVLVQYLSEVVQPEVAGQGPGMNRIEGTHADGSG
jgi:hypothetical protein